MSGHGLVFWACLISNSKQEARIDPANTHHSHPNSQDYCQIDMWKAHSLRPYRFCISQHGDVYLQSSFGKFKRYCLLQFYRYNELFCLWAIKSSTFGSGSPFQA
jgi:hypothetical protein